MNTMTIIVKIIQGKSNEFLQTVRTLQMKLMQDEGLYKTTIYQDLTDTDIFNIVEEWKTQDALDNHMKSEEFRILTGALKILSVESEVRYDLVTDKRRSKILEVL